MYSGCGENSQFRELEEESLGTCDSPSIDSSDSSGSVGYDSPSPRGTPELLPSPTLSLPNTSISIGTRKLPHNLSHRGKKGLGGASKVAAGTLQAAADDVVTEEDKKEMERKMEEDRLWDELLARVETFAKAERAQNTTPGIHSATAYPTSDTDAWLFDPLEPLVCTDQTMDTRGYDGCTMGEAVSEGVHKVAQHAGSWMKSILYSIVEDGSARAKDDAISDVRVHELM